MVKKEKEIRTLSWSAFLLAMTILTLVSVIAFCLYGMYGLSTMIHYQKMDELKIEKEIALINNGFNWEEIIEIEDFCRLIKPFNTFKEFKDYRDIRESLWCFYEDGSIEGYKNEQLIKRGVKLSFN